MNMKLPNAYASHKGGVRCLRDARYHSIDLTLDILGGCAHNCAGCFVNKKLPFLADDLATVADLVDKWAAAGHDFNELFLGPTDIFNASNFDQIVADPNFQRMSEYFTFTCTTTCLNDPAETKRRLELLDEHCSNWRGRDFEVFVVIDLTKFLKDDDPEYMELFHKNLELMYMDNVFFLLNVYSEDMFTEVGLFELNTKFREEYNVKLRINPSYFRGTSTKHVERYAQLHKRMLEDQVNDDNIWGVFNNMFDIYFGGYTFSAYTYVNHELYVAPTIYEGIAIHDDLLHIPRGEDGVYHLSDLENKEKEMFLRQYQYAEQTSECNSCKYLTSCVSRNVIAYMETRNVKDCFLPKTLFRDASQIVEPVNLENRDD